MQTMAGADAVIVFAIIFASCRPQAREEARKDAQSYRNLHTEGCAHCLVVGGFLLYERVFATE